MAISNTQRQESNSAPDGQGGKEVGKENTQVKNKNKIKLPKIMGACFNITIELIMDKLFDLIESISNWTTVIFLMITWILGFVIAKGFWSTLFCWFPFYAWYLVIEHFVIKYNLL